MMNLKNKIILGGLVGLTLLCVVCKKHQSNFQKYLGDALTFSRKLRKIERKNYFAEIFLEYKIREDDGKGNFKLKTY